MLSNKRFFLIPGLALSLFLNMAYATQVCDENIENQWPNNRYTDNNNGTVTDKITGLMWMQCSEGQTSSGNTCNSTATTHNWKAALELTKNTTFAGHSDWRLPNIKELNSLVASNCTNPTINLTLFPNTPSDIFWSSSPYDGDRFFTWGINFDDGDASGYYNRSDFYRARLVRSGQ